MKIFCTSTLPLKQYVLDSNVDGIALTIYVSNLIAGDGYNSAFIETLKTVIKQIGASGKEVAIGIIFGQYCTQSIYSKCDSVSFIKKHHQGEGQAVPIKVPVFYDEGYLTIINNLIYWFAEELRKDSAVFKTIEFIKITGCNESTLEMRATSQDWTDTDVTTIAFMQSTNKWIAAGYTYEKTLLANIRLIEIFKSNFIGKNLILPCLVGVNDFPCIGKDGLYCVPRKRPKIKETILSYDKSINEQITTMDDKTITAAKYVQINESKYKDVGSDVQAVIDYCEQQGKLQLEIFDLNILQNPVIFNT